MPQIEVEFDIDANGILTVVAKDKATGKKADIKITNSGGLTKDEIEKMKRDAEAHAAEDKKRRELVDLKNHADAMVIQTRKALEEHGGKVGADIRGRIESALSNLEDKIKGDDKAAIEAAMKELEKREHGAWQGDLRSAGQGRDGRRGSGCRGFRRLGQEG